MLSGRKNKYRPRRLFLKELQPGKGGYTYEFISAYAAQSSLQDSEAKSESCHKNTGKSTDIRRSFGCLRQSGSSFGTGLEFNSYCITQFASSLIPVYSVVSAPVIGPFVSNSIIQLGNGIIDVISNP